MIKDNADEMVKHYYVPYTPFVPDDDLVEFICKRLDKINVKYTLTEKPLFCSMSPGATFIVFDEKQHRGWIEQEVIDISLETGEETCEYYWITDSWKKDPLVICICKQLDDLGVEYVTYYSPGDWTFSGSTTIKFKEKQNREWIEENVSMAYRTPNIKTFNYTVEITTGNLIDCDNWCIENFGFMEDQWTANFDNNYNRYHFKDDTDAMAFKLKFA